MTAITAFFDATHKHWLAIFDGHPVSGKLFEEKKKNESGAIILNKK